MKNLLIITFALLAALKAGAATTSDANVLMIDSIPLHGNRMDMMTQRIVICGTNHSDLDFEGLVHLFRETDDGGAIWLCSHLLTVSAGWYFKEQIECELPQGGYPVFLASDTEGQHRMADLWVEIGPLRPINFRVTFDGDMMSRVDGETVLSGHRLQGRLTLYNDDSLPYYGVAKMLSHSAGVMYHLWDVTRGQMATHKEFLTAEVEAWQSAVKDIAIDHDFEEGHRYALVVDYAQPRDMVVIDSLFFTFHSGTNTYWTVDGAVHPLPVDGQQLVVPAEAVAVDLRGLYYLNTVFTIDVSQANPNCIYYLDFLDNVPQGMTADCNVVRDGLAANIRLTDNNDFFCPKAFQTKYISYTLKPTGAYGNMPYAETLVLPFNPQGATIDDLNATSEELHDGLLKVFRYSGYGRDSYGVDTLTICEVEANRMLAYTPYIVAVGVSSSVTFYAENAEVPITAPAIAHAGSLDFVGGTMFQTPLIPLPYRYDSMTGCFAVQYGNEPLPPFRAWFNRNIKDGGEPVENAANGENGAQTDGTPSDVSSEFLRFYTGFNLGEASSGVAVPAASSLPPLVYSLSGVRQNPNRLAAGIYVVDGRKQVIR